MKNSDQIVAEITSLAHIDDQLQKSLAILEQAEVNETNWQALKSIAHHWGQQGYRDYQIDFYLKMQAVKRDEDLSFQLARTYFDMQEFEKAQQALNQIQDVNQNYDYLLLDAKLNRLMGNSQQAIETLQALVKNYPQRFEAYEEIAQLYLEFNYKERAKFYYETLLEYFVTEAPLKRREWRLQLMDIIVDSEWIDLEELNQLIEIENLELELPEEFYLLALAYYAGRELEEAEHYALKALELDSEYFEARFLLLEIYAHLGREDIFEERLEETAAYLPPYEPAVIDVLDLADQIEVYTENLLDLLALYYDMEEDARIHYRIIRAHVLYWLKQDNPEQALEKMNAFYFEDVDYLIYLYGRILMAQKDQEAGIYAYRQALELGIDEFDLVYRLVDYYLTTDSKEAKSLIDQYRSSHYYTEELDELWQRHLNE